MSKQIIIFFLLICISTSAKVNYVKPLVIDSCNQESVSLGQIREPEKDTPFLKIFYSELKDWSGTILGIIGFFIARGFFRRLKERHISVAVESIQKANEEVAIKTTKLIDEFLQRTYISERIDKEELLEVTNRIKELHLVSLSGNSESQTLLFYLKFTLQDTSKHFPGEQNNIEFILKDDFYFFIIGILEHVVFYSKQVVTIPKSARIKSKPFIKLKYAKFTSGSKYSTYTSLKRGFIEDPNSALFLVFVGRINDTDSFLLKRSAFKLFWNSNMLYVLMYSKKIYAPLKLEILDSDQRIKDLHLIGFEVLNVHNAVSNSTRKVVRLIYSNPNDDFRFVHNLITNKTLLNFGDSFIVDSGFNITKDTRISYHPIECFTLDFDLNYLEKLFAKNRRLIKRKLPVRYGKFLLAINKIKDTFSF